MSDVTEELRKERPHKSTTHEEMYFHIKEQSFLDGRLVQAATVFARKEDNGYWYCSVARCSLGDQFSRTVGRNVARRRYFQTGRGSYMCDEKPTFEQARLEYLMGR